MKESGINYFYSNLGMDTGAFAVYYTFEDNAGTNVASVSGGQSGYSGTLNSAAGFWTSPGSGHFSGTTLTINNASGLDSPGWTKVFSYEKTSVEPCILFDSLSGSSGCRIGVNKANKPYFQTYNTEPVVATSPPSAEVFSPCPPKPLASQTPRSISPICGMRCNSR